MFHLVENDFYNLATNEQNRSVDFVGIRMIIGTKDTCINVVLMARLGT